MPKAAIKNNSRVISKAEIAEVVNMHMGLGRITLVKSLVLGQKLQSMKDRVEAGEWGKWLRANLSQISPNTVNRYMRLNKERNFIEKKFKIKLVNLETLKDYPDNWPTSVQVDAALREKDQNAPRGEPGKGKTNGKEGSQNGKGTQERKDAKNASPIVAYTLEVFAKELEEVIKRAQENKIPGKIILDTVNAAYQELYKRYKAVEKKVVAMPTQ